MLNPFSPQQDSGSYINLKRRMLQRLKSAKVSDQIFGIVQGAYENALKEENIVLSSPEQKRLLSQLLKSILDDMVKELDKR